MSAGSGASNLGYGNIAPLSNINGKYVNGDSSNNPATFGSNQIPGLPGLAGAKNNVDAAKGYVPGICLFKGGSKDFKKKIKKISRKYKMKGGKHTKRIKRRIKSRFLKRRVSTRKNRISRKNRRGVNKSFKGGQPAYPPGYGQYQNNQPITPSYSVGGILKATDLGLANPPPIQRLSNCTNCVDNYNHYTGKGFASRGH
jgi:hypothetical protein